MFTVLDCIFDIYLLFHLRHLLSCMCFWHLPSSFAFLTLTVLYCVFDTYRPLLRFWLPSARPWPRLWSESVCACWVPSAGESQTRGSCSPRQMCTCPPPVWKQDIRSDNFTYTHLWCPYGAYPQTFSDKMGWSEVNSIRDVQVRVGWLVVLRIYVALVVFQPHRDLEAGDNQSLKFKWRGGESNPGPLVPQAKILTTQPPLLPTG